MSVYLRENSTELHLQPADNAQLPHAIGYLAFFKAETARRHLLESLIDATSALLEHLHLLVAQGHVMEHHEQLKPVAPTTREVNHVHDPVGLLEQVQRFLKLFAFDELVRRVVQFSQHNRDFFF